MFPHGEPVTVITRQRTGVDRQGVDVFTDSETVYSGAFDPAIGSESDQLQDQVSTTPGVYLPYTAAVTASSRVLVRGLLYEVDGEPAYWRNPFTGLEAGVQVPLRRVTG